MPRTRAAYAPEFRTEAARLARSSGKSQAEVACDLGILQNSLRLWCKQTRVDEGLEPGLTTEEREELRYLRREVRVLRQERLILTKAAAFFAKESGRVEPLPFHPGGEGPSSGHDPVSHA